MNFYPRSPCGERRTKTALTSTVLNFYPRSPCGERLNSKGQHTHGKNISIHALLAESDSPKERKEVSSMNFYPRSPCGERRPTKTCGCRMTIFLSTLSLRRATADRLQPEHDSLISIHALLAESDGNPYAGAGDPVISIHALLAESDAEELDKTRRQAEISIHALLAESDGDCIQCCGQVSADFYPRSPCGERHTGQPVRGLPSYFYPRSPCGERLRRATGTAGSLAISIHALLAESDGACRARPQSRPQFLSTLSLRRATWLYLFFVGDCNISIHALLAESDLRDLCDDMYLVISIHALLAESDNFRRPIKRAITYFYPRSPCGERQLTAYHNGQLPDFYPRSPCGERRRGAVPVILII